VQVESDAGKTRGDMPVEFEEEAAVQLRRQEPHRIFLEPDHLVRRPGVQRVIAGDIAVFRFRYQLELSPARIHPHIGAHPRRPAHDIRVVDEVHDEIGGAPHRGQHVRRASHQGRRRLEPAGRMLDQPGNELDELLKPGIVAAGFSPAVLRPVGHTGLGPQVRRRRGNGASHDGFEPRQPRKGRRRIRVIPHIPLKLIRPIAIL